jgi:hypothetical protein
MVLFDQKADDVETQSYPRIFGGEEGFDDPLSIFFGDPAALVGEPKLYAITEGVGLEAAASTISASRWSFAVQPKASIGSPPHPLDPLPTLRGEGDAPKVVRNLDHASTLVLKGGLVLGDRFLFGLILVVGDQLAHSLFVPAGRKRVLWHYRLFLRLRRMYASSGLARSS